MLMYVITLALAVFGQAAQPQTSAAPQSATDSSQMSLGERAAAARKAAAEKANHTESSGSHTVLRPPTPEQQGSVRYNAYVNDFFHFRIDLGSWQILRLTAAGGDESNVLVLRDASRRMVALTIFGLPRSLPGDLGYWTDFAKKATDGELTSPEDLSGYREPVLLGDAAHKFAAFRVAGSYQNLQLVRSEQLTICDGFLIKLQVTGRSHDDVSDALRSLKTSMSWTTTAR